MSKEEKTNVLRILDQLKIPYNSFSVEGKDVLSGLDLSKALNIDSNRMFKTLVTVGKSKEHYVFDIPVSTELDLRKAAKAVGEKSIEMIKQKELLPLTGYIHGGCSPIGMKKQFKTVFDESVILYDKIYFSAGKVGHQVEIAPNDLKKVIDYLICDLTI